MPPCSAGRTAGAGGVHPTRRSPRPRGGGWRGRGQWGFSLRAWYGRGPSSTLAWRSRLTYAPRRRSSSAGRDNRPDPPPLIDNWPSSVKLKNHLKLEAPMGQTQEAKMAALIEKNPDFKNLVQEHRKLDDKLKELDRKVYWTPDEEMERKRLQKLKLAKKDQIARILTSQ